MAEAMIIRGVFRGPEGPRFYRNRKSPDAKAECVAPTALGIRRPCFPALPGGATFFRAYGAPIDESRFSHGLLGTTLSPECAERERNGLSRSGRAWLRRERLPVLACTGTFGHAAGVSSVRARVPVPQNLTCVFACQRATRRSSREPGRMKRPTDLPDSPAKTTGGRHWGPCHRGQKLPRPTLMYFGIAVYCGNYACR
jgi:hypothetical protein